MTHMRGRLPCPGPCPGPCPCLASGLMPVRRRLSRLGLGLGMGGRGMGGRVLFWLRSRVLRGPCRAGKEEQYQCQAGAGTQNGTQQ
jgi:hypothetical protein